MSEKPPFFHISLGNIATIASVVLSAIGIYTDMRLSDQQTSNKLNELSIEVCEVRVILSGRDTNEAILACRDHINAVNAKRTP